MIEMSKNPNYTGNQTFSIPFDAGSLIDGITNGKFSFDTARGNFNAQNPSAIVANRNNLTLPNHIRPRNENDPAQLMPNFVVEPLIKFNLQTDAPRRSQDERQLK
jgi:hypothetical protein